MPAVRTVFALASGPSIPVRFDAENRKWNPEGRSSFNSDGQREYHHTVPLGKSVEFLRAPAVVADLAAASTFQSQTTPSAGSMNL